jgi:peptidoglycan/LPS O-acetylase OafA/YrhL
MADARPRRVDALTGARALAGVYILLLHFGGPIFARGPAPLETMREAGYVATSFFLLLSGFVLTFVYGGRLRDGTLDTRGFFAQRIARLYPAYALALAVMIPFAIVHAWGDATASFGSASLKAKLVTGVAHATMLHAWIPRLVASWNVPDWCVSVEMFFYVTFPILAPRLLRASPRRLVAVFFAAWSVSLAISIGYTIVKPDGFVADAASQAFFINLYKFNPLVRWPEFVCGVALGALYRSLPAGRRGEKFATPLVAATIVAGAAVLLSAHHIPYTLIHDGMLVPLYATLVWSLTAGDGPIHRALSWKPLTTLGNASFALYVMQVPVSMWLEIATGRSWIDLRSPAFTAFFIAVMLPLAVVVQRHVEKPAQAWLRHKLDPRRADSPSPTPTPTPTETAPEPIVVTAAR